MVEKIIEKDIKIYKYLIFTMNNGNNGLAEKLPTRIFFKPEWEYLFQPNLDYLANFNPSFYPPEAEEQHGGQVRGPDKVHPEPFQFKVKCEVVGVKLVLKFTLDDLVLLHLHGAGGHPRGRC